VSYATADCRATSAVQHVASYQPEPNTPLPVYAVPSASEEIETRIAREIASARELGYREGEAQAAAREEAASAAYSPVYYPMLVGGFGSRHHHEKPHQRRPAGQVNQTGRAAHIPAPGAGPRRRFGI